MKPRDLLDTAAILVVSNSRKPAQITLRRAISSCYYALFHCLARECANLLIGGAGADKSKPAWHQVYRSLEHGWAKDRCKQPTIKKFPKQIEDFANTFFAMQEKRHRADYDPSAKFLKSEVVADYFLVEKTIDDFRKANARDRRAFCVYVLLKAARH